MIRDVDLVSYLPPFMLTYKEPVATLSAENPEFLLIWNATDRILYNHFISTADEYGISRFENMLGILPSVEDTVESRRSRVQSKWFNTIPYTMKVLLQKLTVLCANTDFSLMNDFEFGYTLTINTDLELFGQVEELESIINEMIPSNIVVISINSIPCNASATVFLCGGICFVNSFMLTNDEQRTYLITGNVQFGGGNVQTDFIRITNDSKETISAYASVNVGGGIVNAVKVQITNDFNETFQVSGTENVASGAVLSELIEIN